MEISDWLLRWTHEATSYCYIISTVWSALTVRNIPGPYSASATWGRFWNYSCPGRKPGTHPGTSQSQTCLVSKIGWNRAFLGWSGHRPSVKKMLSATVFPSWFVGLVSEFPFGQDSTLCCHPPSALDFWGLKSCFLTSYRLKSTSFKTMHMSWLPLV